MFREIFQYIYDQLKNLCKDRFNILIFNNNEINRDATDKFNPNCR